MNKKWQAIFFLALAEFLAMSLWFSASAVTPALTRAWNLSPGGAAWLTMSVQIGFVVGAFLSALFNVADIWRPRLVFALGAFIGATVNGLIAALDVGLTLAIVLRFFTGFALAAVYPVGMKIMATWMKEDRGLGLGLLVGALTVGSASPHLIRALGGVDEWRYGAGPRPCFWSVGHVGAEAISDGGTVGRGTGVGIVDFLDSLIS